MLKSKTDFVLNANLTDALFMQSIKEATAVESYA